MIFNAYATGADAYLGVCPVSCGHIFAERGREIVRPHGREDFLLFYVVQGEELFFFPQGRKKMMPGDFILFAPGEPQCHRTISEGGGEFYYLHFFADSSFLSEFNLKSGQIESARPYQEIVLLFEKTLSEMQFKQKGYEKLCVCRLFEILHLLLRRKTGEAIEEIPYFDRIAYAVQMIGKECGADYSLEEYAAMVSLSKYHFLHLFKKMTGVTPIAYRNRLRLEYAKEMLTDTAKTIDEIAHAVGIDSPSYFHRFFQKQTGMSPSEYRRKSRQAPM